MKKNKIKPRIKKLSLQQADIIKTHGNNKKLINLIGNIKYTPVNQSILNTINWYKNYYQKKVTINLHFLSFLDKFLNCY